MGMRQQITIFWANSSLPPDVWEGNTNEAEPTTILVPSASRFKIPIYLPTWTKEMEVLGTRMR